MLLKFQKETAIKTFESKKGVCDGYAKLFNYLCLKTGIKSELVDGFAKTSFYEIVPNFSSNHSWNKVFINDKAYLIDTTWGAGTYDEYRGFIKKVNLCVFFN